MEKVVMIEKLVADMRKGIVSFVYRKKNGTERHAIGTLYGVETHHKRDRQGQKRMLLDSEIFRHRSLCLEVIHHGKFDFRRRIKKEHLRRTPSNLPCACCPSERQNESRGKSRFRLPQNRRDNSIRSRTADRKQRS